LSDQAACALRNALHQRRHRIGSDEIGKQQRGRRMDDIDLMTNQGQSIFVFILITSLIIPLLVQIIAPIALMIAAAHVLNKLGNDSELIVMNSAGMPPWVLFRPFLATGIVVSLLVGVISAYVSPWALREARHWATEVRADLVSNIPRILRCIARHHHRASGLRTPALRQSSSRNGSPAGLSMKVAGDKFRIALLEAGTARACAAAIRGGRSLLHQCSYGLHEGHRVDGLRLPSCATSGSDPKSKFQRRTGVAIRTGASQRRCEID